MEEEEEEEEENMRGIEVNFVLLLMVHFSP